MPQTHIFIHFAIIYVFEITYIFCIYVEKMPSNGV